MRAGWSKVFVRIDGSSEVELKPMRPTLYELEAGRHTIEAGGFRFNPAILEIETGGPTSPVIVISPEYRVGVTYESPLGTLSIREENDLRNLQPYAFYKGLPTSFGTDSVLHSVFISIFMSAVFFLLGVALLVAIPVGFVTKGIGAGFFVLILAFFVGSISVPGGLGGMVIGIRFLRMPPGWRSPQKSA
jgi:hypothetical protein